MTNIKFGSQLYTYRNILKSEDDIVALFGRLADYGCKCAQLSGVKVDITPKRLKEIADDYGILIPITHTPFDDILHKTDEVIAKHLELNAHTVGLGMMPIKYMKSVDSLKEFADLVNGVTVRLKENGLSFGYHNHAMEFKKMGDKLVIERLQELCPDMQFIFDTFWCRYAGYDPAEWLHKLNGRVRDIHLKDFKPSIFKIPRFQAIGKGNLDFKQILAVAEHSGTEFAYVEHDTTRDPDETTSFSMQYLKTLYFGK